MLFEKILFWACVCGAAVSALAMDFAQATYAVAAATAYYRLAWGR